MTVVAVPVRWVDAAGKSASTQHPLTVLVVEHNEVAAGILRATLLAAGFEVVRATDADGLLQLAALRRPALVILELLMPRADGWKVLDRLCAEQTAPVIVLTELAGEEHRVRALERGAADYVTKPYSFRELVLRVHSVIRPPGRWPAPSAADAVLVDGDLRVELATGRVCRQADELALTARERALLVCFLLHRGRVFTRGDLLQLVWNWRFGDESTVTVRVRRLREKIEVDASHPRRLLTVWGVGYRYALAAAPAR